jgi:hypothetical protein
MAKNAVVFSGRNGLDFMELRAGILRIPDVTIRIREAQAILDGMDMPKMDLMGTIAGDDEHFFRNIKLKSLASAIVQVGLFDRYQKSQRKPEFLVGNSNGDSAMMVSAGLMSFRDMVERSQALDTLRPQSTEKVIALHPIEATPLLSGLSLTEYQALRTQTDDTGAVHYAPVQAGTMELKKIVSALYQDHEVTRFVSIGPASALRGSDYRALGGGNIESLDSIELDPMLGWFWSNVRPQASALAQ